MRAILLALLLAGCNGQFSAGPTVIDHQANGEEVISSGGQTEVINHPASGEVITSGGATEVIEPPQHAETCYARARYFHGLVPMPCGLANEARP